ncbi:MAG: hypothetical protein GKR89_36335 [Candidatus Latescibacteria bacterium]|nr:hypothetical protein [Candidatus Latescibacterota bacterium]
MFRFAIAPQNAAVLARPVSCLLVILTAALWPQVEAGAKTLALAASGDTVAAAHLVDVLSKAAPGDIVQGNGLVITGPVDLQADSIYCALKITGSQFLGPLQAAGAHFWQEVNFRGSNFGRVHFKGARFERSAQFVGATFADTAHFGAHMKHAANFHRAHFQAHAYMVGLNVDFVANFIKTHFAGTVDLGMSDFEDETIFEDAVFDQAVTFCYAEFHSKTKFKRAVFGGRVDLRETSFARQVDFKGARFDGDLLIEEMYFATIYLSSWAQFKDAVRLASYVDQIDQWVRRPDQVDDIQVTSRLYIQLQDMLRQNGLYEDENNCYYDLKNIEAHYYWRRTGWNPATWLEPLKYAVLWSTCGYGVRPHYTLYLGGVIVFLCTLCYYQRGAISERGLEEMPADRRNRSQRFRDALYFSLNTFTTVGHGDWYPTDNIMRLGRAPLVHFRTIAMLQSLIGWVLITVFVISLGKTWIR